MLTNRGVTLLYVLMALLAVSFIGMNLIKLSGVDAKGSIYYGLTEKARMNTISASHHATTLIESEEGTPLFDSIINHLDIYMKATSQDDLKDYYIIGDSTHYINMPGSSKSKYKARLISFDPSTMMAQIKIDGTSQGGAKSSNVGLYYLDGLEIKIDTVYDTVPDTTFTPMASFKLGGNTDFESNVDVRVDGFCYVNGKLSTNSSDFYFNGPFYQDLNNSNTNINGGSVHFRDVAYLGGHWDFGGDLYFKKAVGFEGGIIGHAKQPYFGGTIYHNGRHTTNWTNAGLHMDWAKRWNVNYQDIHSVSSTYTNGQDVATYLEDICFNKGTYYHETHMDLLDSLNMPDKPADLEVDWDIINSVKHYYTKTKGHTTDGAYMTAQYDKAYALGDTLCGGFVVIEDHPTWDGDGTAVVMKDNGSKIDGKIVYIWKQNHNAPAFPSTTNTSNLIIIANVSNSTTQFGIKYMRGILFVDGMGIQTQPYNPTIIQGATYYGPNAQHYTNGGSGIYYKYDESVLQETNCLGVITDPNDSTISDITDVVSIDKVLSLKEDYTHIVTRLVSRNY